MQSRPTSKFSKKFHRPCIHFHKELIIQPQHNKSATVVLNLFHTKRLHLKEEMMMKSLYEELGGTYTLGDDGMLYPDLAIGDKDSRPIGKWGRMHMKYLEAEHPGLYERLILKGTLNRHLADANERAIRMLERLIVQMAAKEGITESLKKAQSLEWVSRMNSIRSRAEEIILYEVILTL